MNKDGERQWKPRDWSPGQWFHAVGVILFTSWVIWASNMLIGLDKEIAKKTAGLEERITVIENNRFTSSDGLDFVNQLLAHRTEEHPITVARLMAMQRQLERIETILLSDRKKNTSSAQLSAGEG